MKLPSLPELALLRPITVTMMVITIAGMGAIAHYNIPLEFMPKMDMPFIGVIIPYPGATPAQVENEIAIPAEGQFRTLNDLRRITTQSDSNGCNVRLEFNSDVDLRTATAEVRDRIERLRLELPAEVDRMQIQRFSSDTLPIMMFSLSRDGDEDEFSHLARTRIRPRLNRIEGVADIVVYGKPQKEVLIEFDQNRLRSANLGLYQIIETLRTSSLNVSVGELNDGKTKHFVRVFGEFRHPTELGEVVVGPHGLRLKEVAKVSFSSREANMEYTVDGNKGVFVLAWKESEANTIATCNAIKAEMDRMKDDPLYGGMELLLFFDQGEVIMSAVNGLAKAGVFGGSLALVVLFLFLRRIRPTMIVACAIPFSLVVGLVYMYFTGMTLNLVTLTSMIVGIGLLVDNSIVVMENIYRHQQLGDTPKEAAKKGASEVGLAITAATMTTLVVFVPTLYLEQGQMAIFMIQFAIPMSVALLASLLIALTVIPLAASRLRPREHLWIYDFAQAHLKNLGLSLTAPTAGIRSRCMALYTGGLARSLKLRSAVIIAVVAIGYLTWAIPVKRVGTQDMPTADTRQVEIRLRFDQNIDFAMARERLNMVEEALEGMRDELEIKTLWRSNLPRRGEIKAYLMTLEDYPKGEEPRYSTEDTLNIMWQRLPKRLPGVELRFSIPEAGQGQSRSIALRIQGDDRDELAIHAERFADLLAEIPDISDVNPGTEQNRLEMQIGIDEDLAGEAGVSPMVVAQTVDFALGGVRLPYMKREGREIPVWGQFREKDRKSRQNLENVGIGTPQGTIKPLKELVNLQRARSPNAIRRVDGKNVITITARTATSDMGSLFSNIRQLVSSFELPRGYELNLGDQFMKLDSNAANFITSLLLACILIYIVMGALFESYFLPLSILTCIPVAFIGVFWAMYLTNTSMDTITYIGLILMIGIVVNNGIVIVDYINQLRRGGMDRDEAVVQAGRDRLRPVLMTALTTILGCVPLALEGQVGTQVSFVSLGRALIGGLTTSTVLTLYIVPVVYTLIDDFQEWALRFLGDIAGLATGRVRSTQDFVGK
jgi:HAE1 family hydrophobic/amphiphilic exporter-1